MPLTCPLYCASHLSCAPVLYPSPVLCSCPVPLTCPVHRSSASHLSSAPVLCLSPVPCIVPLTCPVHLSSASHLSCAPVLCLSPVPCIVPLICPVPLTCPVCTDSSEEELELLSESFWQRVAEVSITARLVPCLPPPACTLRALHPAPACLPLLAPCVLCALPLLAPCPCPCPCPCLHPACLPLPWLLWKGLPSLMALCRKSASVPSPERLLPPCHGPCAMGCLLLWPSHGPVQSSVGALQARGHAIGTRKLEVADTAIAIHSVNHCPELTRKACVRASMPPTLLSFKRISCPSPSWFARS